MKKRCDCETRIRQWADELKDLVGTPGAPGGSASTMRILSRRAEHYRDVADLLANEHSKQGRKPHDMRTP